MKSYLIWEEIKNYCLKNPGKIAAIIVPEGYYEIRFFERKAEEQKEPDRKWIIDRFLWR